MVIAIFVGGTENKDQSNCESSSSRPGIVMIRELHQDEMKFIPSTCLPLHYVEGFKDDDACAALQNWAAPGFRDCLIE